MSHDTDKALLNEAKRLIARMHGMPWVTQDVDKALADKVEGPILRELLVMVPDLVDALDNLMTEKSAARCTECDEVVPGVMCGDCYAEETNHHGVQIEDEGGGA